MLFFTSVEVKWRSPANLVSSIEERSPLQLTPDNSEIPTDVKLD
ncbi:hypothetical protein [Laspinema olomoucense]|nr:MULTISPECIES: hypothetical protein [unclassified Laspinema]